MLRSSTPTISITDLITQEANAQGVPPAIALGVAQTESGISQWLPNGNVVTSSAGALGVFQLMPATAAGLGVDPTDLTGNITGGITYLKQLFDKYGDWSTALAAYNWGSGHVDSGSAIPGSVMGYVDKVLNAAGSFATKLVGSSLPTAASSPAVTAAPDYGYGVTADASFIPDLSDLSATPGAGTSTPSINPGWVVASVIALGLAIWWLLPDY